MNPQDIDEAILRTMAYAAAFDAAIALPQLTEWLITSKKITRNALHTRLKILQGKKMVVMEDQLIGLQPSFLSKSLVRRSVSTAKRDSFIESMYWITWIPSIHGIAVTGSIAARNATANDDIDLLVVVQSGTLWMTRLMVLIISLLLGKLRHGQMKHTKNRWCFNMWLDTSALSIEKHTLYIAREVVQAEWVWQRDEVKQIFLSHNVWIRDYLANVSVAPLAGKKPSRSSVVSGLTLIEKAAYLLQLWHMRSALTREVVDAHRAFFHPRDTNGAVFKRYEQLARQVLKRYNSSKYSQ